MPAKLGEPSHTKALQITFDSDNTKDVGNGDFQHYATFVDDAGIVRDYVQLGGATLLGLISVDGADLGDQIIPYYADATNTGTFFPVFKGDGEQLIFNVSNAGCVFLDNAIYGSAIAVQFRLQVNYSITSNFNLDVLVRGID